MFFFELVSLDADLLTECGNILTVNDRFLQLLGTVRGELKYGATYHTHNLRLNSPRVLLSTLPTALENILLCIKWAWTAGGMLYDMGFSVMCRCEKHSFQIETEKLGAQNLQHMVK